MKKHPCQLPKCPYMEQTEEERQWSNRPTHGQSAVKIAIKTRNGALLVIKAQKRMIFSK